MPLEPEARPPSRWLPRRAAGVVCLSLGLLSTAIALVVVLRTGSMFGHVPDWRLMVPLWAAAAVAAAASGVRREGHYGLAVAGVALASGAMALGWVLVLAAVVAVTLVIIYVMSEMF